MDNETSIQSVRSPETGLIYTKTIGQAIGQPKVRNVEITALKDALTEMITEVFRRCGQTLESDDLVTEVFYLSEGLIKNFSGLSLAEVRIALINGTEDKYGEEWYGLNYKTFSKWLYAYRNSEQRKRALKEQQKQRPALPEQTTYRSTPEQTLKALYDGYQSWGGLPQPLVDSVYAHLTKTGVIPEKHPLKREIYDNIADYVKRYRDNRSDWRFGREDLTDIALIPETFKAYMREKESKTAALTQLEEDLKRLASSDEIKKSWCRQVMMKMYFDNLKKSMK